MNFAVMQFIHAAVTELLMSLIIRFDIKTLCRPG